MNAKYVTLLVLLLAGGCLAPHYGVDATDAPSKNSGASGSSPLGGSQASGGTTSGAGQPDGGADSSGGTSPSPAGGQGGDSELGNPPTVTCGPQQKKCGGKCVEISDVAYGCSPTSCNQVVCPADPQAILGCDEPACVVTGCKDGFKKCGSRCVSVDDPKYGCGPSSCDDTACPDPGGGTLICDAGKCVVGACSAATKKCGNKCVPQNEDNGCSGQSCDACAANEVCSGNPAQCTCVPNGDPCTGYECGTAKDSCGREKTCTDKCTGTQWPICIGNTCKECSSASDCPAPANNPCFKAICTANTCGLAPVGAGKSCSGGGTCSTTEPGACNRPPVSVGTFNIDATEVTRAQYSAFLKAKNGDMSGQTGGCAWNTTYTPDVLWPGTPEIADNPVAYVDWCDANAYCKWAGRRLCGKLGGGHADYITIDHDGSQTEWVHACMPSPGTHYPYGNVYKINNCNGKSGGDFTSQVASYPACVGGVPGLYDMSGNVAEWIDACDHYVDDKDFCSTQGGHYNSPDDGSTLVCDGGAVFNKTVTTYDIGFRCCGP